MLHTIVGSGFVSGRGYVGAFLGLGLCGSCYFQCVAGLSYGGGGRLAAINFLRGVQMRFIGCGGLCYGRVSLAPFHFLRGRC
jgi:hypothetical protein